LTQTLQPMLANFDLPAAAVIKHDASHDGLAESSSALDTAVAEHATVQSEQTPDPSGPQVYDQDGEPAWKEPTVSPVSSTGPAAARSEMRPSLSQIDMAGASHSVTGDTPGFISW
jgi:hypothetical protein